MPALLIDPVEKTVTAIDIEPGLAALRAALGCQWIDITSVGRDQTGKPLDLISDDEGRLIDGQSCFRLGGADGLLIAGRGLLLSSDREGATIGTAMDHELVLRQLEWLGDEFDYEPPAPVVIGFDSLEMLQFIM